jgi:hypothetical protein
LESEAGEDRSARVPTSSFLPATRVVCRAPSRTIFQGAFSPLSHVPSRPETDELREPRGIFGTAWLMAELHHFSDQGIAIHPERHPINSADDMVVTEPEFHARLKVLYNEATKLAPTDNTRLDMDSIFGDN